MQTTGPFKSKDIKLSILTMFLIHSLLQGTIVILTLHSTDLFKFLSIISLTKYIFLNQMSIKNSKHYVIVHVLFNERLKAGRPPFQMNIINHKEIGRTILHNLNMHQLLKNHKATNHLIVMIISMHSAVSLRMFRNTCSLCVLTRISPYAYSYLKACVTPLQYFSVLK